MGSKFLCMRSTPTETQSTSENDFECLASTGVNAPGTIFPDLGPANTGFACNVPPNLAFPVQLPACPSTVRMQLRNLTDPIIPAAPTDPEQDELTSCTGDCRALRKKRTVIANDAKQNVSDLSKDLFHGRSRSAVQPLKVVTSSHSKYVIVSITGLQASAPHLRLSTWPFNTDDGKECMGCCVLQQGAAARLRQWRKLACEK